MFVLGFVIPKIYELRKDDIDSAVSSGYTQSQKGYQQYLKPYVEKIPRASTSARSSGATSNTTGPTAAGMVMCRPCITQPAAVLCASQPVHWLMPARQHCSSSAAGTNPSAGSIA